MSDKRVAGIAMLCSIIVVVGVQIICALIGCCRAECQTECRGVAPCGNPPLTVVPLPPMISAGMPGNLVIIGPECCPPPLPDHVKKAYLDGIEKLDKRCHALAAKAGHDLKTHEAHLRTALRRDLLKLALFRREKGHRAAPGATEALLHAKAAEAIHQARVKAKADDGAISDAEFDAIMANVALQEAILAAAMGPGWLPAAGTLVFTGNLTDNDLQGLLTLELNAAPAPEAKKKALDPKSAEAHPAAHPAPKSPQKPRN